MRCDKRHTAQILCVRNVINGRTKKVQVGTRASRVSQDGHLKWACADDSILHQIMPPLIWIEWPSGVPFDYRSLLTLLRINFMLYSTASSFIP